MLFTLYRIGTFLALHLPLRVSYAIAAFIALTHHLFSKKDKQAVKANLSVIFPSYDDKELNVIAKQVFVNFAKYLIDFFRFSKIDKDYVKKYVKVEGLRHLKEALKKQKGAIALTAHLGNWELGGIVLPLLDINLASVALDNENEKIRSFFRQQRAVSGAEVISSAGSSLRRCFSALAENYVIALVGDRDYFDNGIKVDFFGKPTILPKGPAVFSRRCGAPIIPTFVIRNADDSFIFRFDKMIEAEITEDENRDIIETTKKIARVLEDVIREYPTQWHVFRRFWERIGLERKTL